MQSQSGASVTDAVRTRARNKAAFVLFGRAAMTTLSIVSAALGFMTGVRMQRESYDPYAYATGAGALFAAACAVIAFLLTRRRMHDRKDARRWKRASRNCPTAIGNCARRKSARAACWKRKAT